MWTGLYRWLCCSGFSHHVDSIKYQYFGETYWLHLQGFIMFLSNISIYLWVHTASQPTTALSPSVHWECKMPHIYKYLAGHDHSDGCFMLINKNYCTKHILHPTNNYKNSSQYHNLHIWVSTSITGVRLWEQDGQLIGLPLPIHLSGNLWFKYITSLWKCGGSTSMSLRLSSSKTSIRNLSTWDAF